MTCDTLRREYQSARAHLDNGISVLRTWQQEVMDDPRATGASDFEDINDLLIIFLRLDLGETLHDNRRKPQLLPVREKSQQVSIAKKSGGLRPTFASTQDAVERYISMFHGIWIFLVENAELAAVDISEVPTTVRLKKRELQARIALWLDALHHHRETWFTPEIREGVPNIRSKEDYSQLTELMVLDITWAQCLSNSWLLAESIQDDDPKANVDADAETIFELAERYISQKRTVRELNGRWDSRDLTVLVGVSYHLRCNFVRGVIVHSMNTVLLMSRLTSSPCCAHKQPGSPKGDTPITKHLMIFECGLTITGGRVHHGVASPHARPK